MLIQTHDNPDPDCLGSAVALRHLVARYAGIPADVVHGGTVGRSENRAMLRLLRIRPLRAAHVDYSRYDLVCVVDTQPVTGYASLPEGQTVHVVFDHHPLRAEIPGALLVEVDEGAGSTCTLVGEMMLANGVPVGQEVATALAFGIKAETLDLGRETSSRDEAVYTALYPLANRRLLARIERESAPPAYFREFSRALRSARVHDHVVVSDVGEIGGPDIVPEAADFLLRLQGMRWSCVMGTVGDRLHVSLRAASARQRAGSRLRRVLRGMGSAGGHGSMAGGQIPLTGMTPEERGAVAGEFRTGLLAALHARDLRGSPLVPPATSAPP